MQPCETELRPMCERRMAPCPESNAQAPLPRCSQPGTLCTASYLYGVLHHGGGEGAAAPKVRVPAEVQACASSSKRKRVLQSQ